MTMEFLVQNKLNTITQIVVDAANTATIENIFDRDTATQWETVGYTTDTSSIFSIEFGSSTIIDRIFFQNHNLKQFRVFYNSATANTFSTDINETTNSETSNYYTFNSITVSSIQVQCDATMVEDNEIKIGDLYVGAQLLNFERNPSAADYKPIIERKDVLHKMPNGGVSQFIVDEKFKAQIKWKYLTNSFTSDLLDIYNTGTAFYFLPFPTTTSWDGNAYEVVWANDFDFRHSSNNKDAGQGGKIVLQETA